MYCVNITLTVLCMHIHTSLWPYTHPPIFIHVWYYIIMALAARGNGLIYNI